MCTKYELAIAGAKGYLSSLVSQEISCGGIHSLFVVTASVSDSLHVADIRGGRDKDDNSSVQLYHLLT